MKKSLLATAAAMALIASAGLASAQKQEAPASSTQMPNAAPPSQQQAPAEKKAPATRDKGAQMPSKSETTGQGQPKSADDSKKSGTTGQAQPKGDDMKAQPKSSEQPKGSPSAQPKSSEQPKGSTAQQPGAQPKSGTAQQPGSQQSPTTGQATAPSGAAVNLTTEQKTRIRSTVLTASAPRVSSVNFAVSVGTVVPRTVHL